MSNSTYALMGKIIKLLFSAEFVDPSGKFNYLLVLA